MANQTVYPYGTGGSLPASIGIVNDLSTGGVDKALSAQQGVIIGNRAVDKTITVLSSSLAQHEMSISVSGSWQGNSVHHHVVFPVTPGETIKFTVLSSDGSDGASCGFVSSLYNVEQTPTAGKVQVCPGGVVRWAFVNTTYEWEVPEYAVYLAVTANTNTYTAQSKLERTSYATIHNDFFEKRKGDELYDGILGEYVDYDLSQLTVSPCYLGQGNKWDAAGTHIVVPVTPRQVVKIAVIGSSSDGGFYAFLNSTYTVPSGGDSIPYVEGCTRVWRSYPGSDIHGLELTVPEGASYLCLCPLCSTTKTAVWSLAIKTLGDIANSFISRNDIVNDITTGGVTVPLAAEQGKVLASFVTDGIPAGLQRYTYNGAPVKISNQRYVATAEVSTITSISCQGGACFGDYLFMFSTNMETVWMYNLATKQLIQTITVAEGERGFVSNCHANTVNFGTEYYDSNDPFPLIYVSTGYNDGTDTGALVYRIVATTENDVTTYSLILVQTLKMPGTTWTEFVTGDDVCFLCYTGPRIIYRMKMPKLSDGDITFDLDEALEVYNFTLQPAWWNGSRNQCRIYKDGKIYVISGVPGSATSSEKSLFFVLDLATCTREVVINLQTLGLNSEPEAIFFWNNKICIAFRSNSRIYALYFE